jgi:hypothetical protein
MARRSPKLRRRSVYAMYVQDVLILCHVGSWWRVVVYDTASVLIRCVARLNGLSSTSSGLIRRAHHQAAKTDWKLLHVGGLQPVPLITLIDFFCLVFGERRLGSPNPLMWTTGSAELLKHPQQTLLSAKHHNSEADWAMPLAAAGSSTCSTTIHSNGNPGGVFSRPMECKRMLRFYKFRDHVQTHAKVLQVQGSFDSPRVFFLQLFGHQNITTKTVSR